MSIAVTTRAYDLGRSGTNTAETVLSATAVKARGIRRTATAVLPLDARGTEATAIVVPSLVGGDGSARDVLLQCNMGGYISTFDARDATPLTQVRAANAVLGTPQMDMFDINAGWAFLATPTVDLETGIAYATTMTSPDGTYAKGFWEFVSIDVATGAVLTRLDLSEASYQPPGDLPRQTFGKVERKIRCACTLTSIAGVKTVFVGAGSFNEDADTNQGWVIALDVTSPTPAIAAAWPSSARYGGAGIWMAGQGLVADAQGCVGFVTGNGAFDGLTEFGECIVKLRYTPATPGKPAALAVDSWLPLYSDTGVVGGDPTLADTSLIPGFDDDDDKLRQASNANGASDMDAGSSGLQLVLQAQSGFTKDVVVCSSKVGTLYLADWNNLGSPGLSVFAPDKIETEFYPLFLARPVWGTYYNPEADPAPADFSKLPPIAFGKTHHMHSTPVYLRSRVHGPSFWLWGENGNLRGFALTETAGVFGWKYLGCSAEVASADCGPPGGMPGGMLTACANGDADPVLFATIPYGDANKTVGPGRLLAYDIDNLGTFPGGGGRIPVLWDSQAQADTFVYNKFTPPTVANGLLYVPDYAGAVHIYTLA